VQESNYGEYSPDYLSDQLKKPFGSAREIPSHSIPDMADIASSHEASEELS